MRFVFFDLIIAILNYLRYTKTFMAQLTKIIYVIKIKIGFKFNYYFGMYVNFKFEMRKQNFVM